MLLVIFGSFFAGKKVVNFALVLEVEVHHYTKQRKNCYPHGDTPSTKGDKLPGAQKAYKGNVYWLDERHCDDEKAIGHTR